MPRGNGTGQFGQGPGSGRGIVRVRDAAEAEWEGHLPQGQVEVVYAPTAATKKRI